MVRELDSQERNAADEHRSLASRRALRRCDVGDVTMAKGQKKSNKEARKPKAEKPPKPNASAPSAKGTPAKPLND